MGQITIDTHAAWVVARAVAGQVIDDSEIAGLQPPWRDIAVAAQRSNGHGRINAMRKICSSLPDGDAIEKAILQADPSKKPRRRIQPGAVPDLPSHACCPIQDGDQPAAWLDDFTAYARSVSPITPALFLEASGIWLISLAIARRLVLRMSHKEVYPNLAVLQIAPTTLYAKSTGLNVARFLALRCFPHLLLPGEMTPEAMIEELAGKQPTILEGLDLGDWQRGQAYAAQRGMCLDEASSLFTGMSRDYNIGMGETLLRLYDCDPSITRQTRGSGRATVRNSYWCFLGCTTPWYVRKADVDTLWHAGLWPRFLLLTPDRDPFWQMPTREREQLPAEIPERLRRLCDELLPESKHNEPAEPLSVGLGDGVFDAFSQYLQATMHEMLIKPSTVDPRLYGVYGRLAEQALKISLCLCAIDWDGNGVPVIQMRHWARAQQFVETCRYSAHRLPGLLATADENEEENKILVWLDSVEDWQSAREIYRGINLKSAIVKGRLIDLVEAGIVDFREKGRTTEYRLAKFAKVS